MNGRISNNNYLLDKIGKTQSQKQEAKKTLRKQNKNFSEVFNKIKTKQDYEVKISKHAQERLKMRNVNISKDRLNDVAQAMDRASEKGIKDALIILDGNALIASVQNRTIVTCAKQDSLDSKIITNIDGAIVL